MNGTLLLIRKARAFYFANLAWERVDNPTQFKVRLQFRRTHQPGKLTFKQASPKEYDFNCTDSEVKWKFTNLAIGFFLDKEWWWLVEDILRVQKQPWLAYKIAFGRDQNNKS
jgi:hypothetical protein